MHPDALKIDTLAHAPVHPNGKGRLPVAVLADVLEDIADHVGRFVCLPDSALAMLMAVWVVETYCYQLFSFCGYLTLQSATVRCGKSRLLELLALFANDNPPVTTIPTAAVLFRSTRAVQILDEVDKLKNADKETYGELLGVLNCGFKSGAIVERVERGPGGFITKAYPVYGPKMLAGIEGLADALQDRAFRIVMQRTPKRMPRLNGRRLEEVALKIRTGLATWVDVQAAEIERAYHALPDELGILAGYDDRFQDIAEPLVVLASLADAERPQGNPILPRLLDGLRAAAGRREPQGRERELLTFLEIAKEYLKDEEEVFIGSEEVVTLCQTHEDLSWIETKHKLARFLKPFELYPRKNRDKTLRGYLVRREWVMTWEARYG